MYCIHMQILSHDTVQTYSIIKNMSKCRDITHAEALLFGCTAPQKGESLLCGPDGSSSVSLNGLEDGNFMGSVAVCLLQ